MGSSRWLRAPWDVRPMVRRGVHLLLGGVILLPYVLLATGFVQMFADPAVPVVPTVILVAVTAVIGAVPPFLPALRALEITASRSLLGADLPDPVADPPWETRLFGAGWYVLHLACGGLAVAALLLGAPFAAILLAEGFGAADWDGGVTQPVVDRLSGGWAVAAGLVIVVATLYLIAGLGALLAKFAPLLLGPSPAELLIALETQAEEFAERNRLARELHDSVGHALTVTTLQAAAARRVLDTDPEFTRRALLAVEEAGRSAMAELDHVLGVLRAGGAAPNSEASPQRTLADLPRLVDDTRAAGVQVRADVSGDLGAAPPVVSREAYRIVQEALTNAVRHAGAVPVDLVVESSPAGVHIDVSNPLPVTTAPGQLSSRPNGGRGLRGMKERVRLLRGELSAAADGDVWRVRVHLPAGGGRR